MNWSTPFLSLLFALALPCAQSYAQEVLPAPSNTLERPLAAGSSLRLKLSAGAYRIRAGEAQDKIKVTWRTEDSRKASRVSVSLVNEAEGSLLTAKGPRDNFEVEIEVPARLDLDVDMTVGDLSISGVEGHKRIDLNIGDIMIDIGKAENYQRARAAVKIGEIDAPPFQARHEGFFRSFDWRGAGPYRLGIRLGIGEITLK